MRIFHQLIYDGFVCSGEAVYSDPQLNQLIGSVDLVSLSGYTFNWSGASPALAINLQHSPNLDDWVAIQMSGSGIVPSTTAETVFQFSEQLATGLIKATYARMQLVSLNSGCQGYVRVWATGRDQSK